MSLLPYLMYYADKRLRTPFDRVYDGITSFMGLASEATRLPIHADVSRHLIEDNRIVEPIEQNEAGVDSDSHDTVRVVIEEGLRRFREPDVSVMVTWCPNLQWGGEDTFCRIDLQEEKYYLGQERTHFLRIVASNVPNRHVWAFVYLATPFEKVCPEFDAFVREAERHLPFRLSPAKWRQASPTKNGKGIKLRRIKKDSQ